MPNSALGEHGQDARATRHWPRRAVMVAAMVLGGLFASLALTEATGVTHLATTLVRIVTGAGTLVVEVDDPQVSITIDGEDLVITGAGPQEVRLKPGQYQVQATKGGQVVKQELVTVERGSRQVVRVALEPSVTPLLGLNNEPPVEPPAAGGPTAPPPPALSRYEVRRYLGHTAGLKSVCVSPDGKHIASASADRTLRLWELKTGAELRRFEGHTDCVTCAAFLPDGKRIASGSLDGTVRLWEAETGRQLKQFIGHTGPLWSGVAVLADGKRVVSASTDQTLRVWDIETGSEVRRLRLDQQVVGLAATPDGRLALCGDGAGDAQVWDLEKGSLVRKLSGHKGPVLAVAVSPDGRRGLSAGTGEGIARLWDLETGREIRRFEGDSPATWSLALSADGSSALAGGHAVMFLWDVNTGRRLRTFRAWCEFAGVAFVPDGCHAVSAPWTEESQQCLLRLWELPYSLWPKPTLAEHLDELSKSIQSNPQDAQLFEQRGRLYSHLGRYDAAALDFIRARDLSATPGAWDYTSGLFDSLMQHEEVFAAIAARRPDDNLLWGARGNYCAARSQWKRAAAAYARASEEPTSLG